MKLTLAIKIHKLDSKLVSNLTFKLNAYGNA